MDREYLQTIVARLEEIVKEAKAVADYNGYDTHELFVRLSSASGHLTGLRAMLILLRKEVFDGSQGEVGVGTP